MHLLPLREQVCAETRSLAPGLLSGPPEPQNKAGEPQGAQEDNEGVLPHIL